MKKELRIDNTFHKIVEIPPNTTHIPASTTVAATVYLVACVSVNDF